MPASDPDNWKFFLQYLWGVVLLPIKALWSKNTELKKENEETLAALNEHKLHVANNHFDKPEVERIIKGAIEPIKDSVDRLTESVDKLVDRELKK